VSRHKTASYNPQANGCVERQNATISKTIAKYVQKDQKNWHRILPVALMGMRSQPNTETSAFSPYKMLFGGEMRLPFDTTLVPRDNLKPQDKVIVNELLETLKLVHGTAKTNTEITQNESKEKHDIEAKNSDFMLLELVLKKVHKHTPGLSGKLEEKWDGPFYIVAKGPNDTYKLANCKTNKVGKSFDTSRNLKRYYQPDVYRYNLMSEQTDNDPEIDNDDHVEGETDANFPGTTTMESQEKQNTEKDQPETTTSNEAITDETENKSDNTQEQNNETPFQNPQMKTNNPNHKIDGMQ
jgi:hypothetical protein